MKNSHIMFIAAIIYMVFNVISMYGMELTYIERVVASIPMILIISGAYIVDAIEQLKEKK